MRQGRVLEIRGAGSFRARGAGRGQLACENRRTKRDLPDARFTQINKPAPACIHVPPATPQSRVSSSRPDKPAVDAAYLDGRQAISHSSQPHDSIPPSGFRDSLKLMDAVLR